MESNYRNREFEQFIKENAEQYRMFPSEKVWKGIHGTLHTRKKWYGLGLGLLLLVTATAVTWVMVSYPVSKDQSVAAVQESPATIQPASENSTEDINKVLPFSKTITAPKKIATSSETITPTPGLYAQDEDKKLIASEHAQSARNEKNQFISEVSSPKTPSGDILAFNTPKSELPVVAENKKQIFHAAPSDRPSSINEINYPAFENITDAYLPKNLTKKISWQVFITPTISYRKLDENKSFENGSSASPGFPFASLTDVNKAVTHKPDMGLQVGVTARYPVTKRLKITGGLQFNINRYDIKAFAYNPEVATINLNDENGINSVSTWTSFRTSSGYKSDWLKNYYFSVSVPIGAELRLLGNERTNFGIAGTVQPTYTIKDRAYLISTDYKNYAKFPWLIRHLNVNTSFEAFVNYKSGRTRWQIGPQVRYQVLSSFHNKYPVKENLFDFGMKLGVMLND